MKINITDADYQAALGYFTFLKWEKVSKCAHTGGALVNLFFLPSKLNIWPSTKCLAWGGNVGGAA